MILELHNVRMEPSNVRDSRNVRRTVTYDVGTAQCEDETVKYEKKITWCSRLPTSGYRTHPPFLGYSRITPIISVI